MSTTITIDGNVVAAPTLKFTPSGHAIATFTVAVNNRQKKAGEWVDAPATYHDIEAWNALAEHAADSLLMRSWCRQAQWLSGRERGGHVHHEGVDVVVPALRSRRISP